MLSHNENMGLPVRLQGAGDPLSAQSGCARPNRVPRHTLETKSRNILKLNALRHRTDVDPGEGLLDL
jgi:hypothetical protein